MFAGFLGFEEARVCTRQSDSRVEGRLIADTRDAVLVSVPLTPRGNEFEQETVVRVPSSQVVRLHYGADTGVLTECGTEVSPAETQPLTAVGPQRDRCTPWAPAVAVPLTGLLGRSPETPAPRASRWGCQGQPVRAEPKASAKRVLDGFARRSWPLRGPAFASHVVVSTAEATARRRERRRSRRCRSRDAGGPARAEGDRGRRSLGQMCRKRWGAGARGASDRP